MKKYACSLLFVVVAVDCSSHPSPGEVRCFAVSVDAVHSDSTVRMEVASSRPDYLPTLSAAKSSKLSLLVKHHILAIDEAS